MEITQSELTPSRKMTRREFLKIAGLSAAGGWLALQRWVFENGPASLISSFLTRDLKEDTPTEFLNEKEDPNPFFENPDSLLKKSFELYSQSNEENPSQYPALTLHKRKNYISMEDVLRRYKGSKPEKILEDITSRRFSIASKALSPDGSMFGVNQQTGGDILYFSGAQVKDVNDLIRIDPGSGFVSRAISRSFNMSRDEFYSSHPLEKGFSEYETKKIQESVVKDSTDAINYFKSVREKSNTPLDLSEALVYFYKLNQGDIYAGLWDSVMFFKLLARNNSDTLIFNPTFSQSMLLADLFIDPFSPRDSLNWLARKYREKGVTETHQLAQPNSSADSDKFKDYMVVNRAGGIYHGLNILTWAAVCMDPLLVEMVTTAYSGWKVGDLTAVAEHGKIKIESDLIVALKSPEIRQVVNRYIKVL